MEGLFVALVQPGNTPACADAPGNVLHVSNGKITAALQVTNGLAAQSYRLCVPRYKWPLLASDWVPSSDRCRPRRPSVSVPKDVGTLGPRFRASRCKAAAYPRFTAMDV